MTTRNTIEDLAFAQMYLEFVAKRSMNGEARARASIVLALIRMLDTRYPTWKQQVLEELNANSVTKDISKMFSLPDAEVDSLFNKFLKQIAKDEE